MAQNAWTDADMVSDSLVEKARSRRALKPVGREGFAAWAAGLSFVAVAVPFAVLVPSTRTTSLWVLGLLVLLYAFLSRIELEVGSVTVVPSELAFVAMLALLPASSVPVAVGLALVLGHLSIAIRGRIHPSRLAQLLGNAWFAVGAAAVIAATGEPTATPSTIGIYAAALLAQMATDAGITAAREVGILGIPPRLLVRPLAWMCVVDGLLFPVGYLAAMAATEQPHTVLLSAPIGLLMVVVSYERRAHVDSVLELSTAYRRTALLLGDVIEADDSYTAAHSDDVVALVVVVSERLGLGVAESRKAELTALLHDVGKLRIPKAIINKPGPLAPDERALIETHTIEGEKLLTRVGGLLGEVGTLVRSCHERFDGTGYPDGLTGPEIPLISRIVCCCDAYNAMITTRPYRGAMSQEEAVAELLKCSGTHFDPDVVAALLEVLGVAAPSGTHGSAGMLAA